MGDRTAPKCQLRLEWVYGYRGHQVRSNLYYNKADEIVYFVAGVGIVYNPVKHKQRFFLEHDDDIISLAVHPDKEKVATGQLGKEPKIIIWNSIKDDLPAISILKGSFRDGVGIIAFDIKGEKLAAVAIDQDSTISVWDCKKAKLLTKTNSHLEKIFDLQFSPYKENTLVSCGVKQISFWSIIGNTIQRKKGLFGQLKDMQTMFCMAFSNQQDIIYTGTLNGCIYVWKGTQLEEIIPDAHEGSIYVMAPCLNGFVTAGRDGKLRIWDSSFVSLDIIDLKSSLNYNEELTVRSICWNNNRFLVGTQSSEIYEIRTDNSDSPNCLCQGHAEGELWALATSPTDPDIFATASDDMTIRLWNMKTKERLKFKQMNKRIRSCSFSIDSKNLACGLSDGSLVVLNLDDMSEIFREKMRNEVLHEMKYSPCGKYLAVGSNDNFVDILETKKYKRIGICKGNSSFITHLDWTSDSQFVRTNSGAGDNLIFKITGAQNCKLATTEESKKIINWQTFTGVLGDEAVGIWEKYTNKTDVNATDAYFEQGCIVTGDDFGLVKLFRFPSLKKGAKYRKYVGHSSHVTNVRFSSDKNRVISIGGADHAIFQWRFVSEDFVEQLNDESLAIQDAIQSGRTADTRLFENLPPPHTGYLDTDSEESDSELSGREIDSDIEKEKEVQYERQVYKDDLKVLKPKIKDEIKKAETDTREKRQARPELSLNLKYVHGYRGYDCRDNIFCIQPSGDIVFHVAALGIVYNKETNSQKFYDQHTDDILCLSLHPNKIYVATGQIGRDPPIHVWDADKLKTISILKGQHERGICSLNFSNDGKKLASIGLDDYHTICVWEWRKGEKLASTRGHQDKIFCIKWNPHDTDKLVTVGVKHIKFWNQVGAGFTSNRGVFGNLSKVENMMCITFGKTANVCYTGVGNGSIFYWLNQKLAKVITAHEGPVFSIFAYDGYDHFATGGKDGHVILWNNNFSTQEKKYNINKESLVKKNQGMLFQDNPSIKAICLASAYKRIIVGTKNGEILEVDIDGAINILTQGHCEGELWGLACHPKKQECCTVSDDKSLRIWDLNTNKMIALKVLPKPARSCEYSPDGSLIAVGMKDGSVLVIKTETFDELKTINNRNSEISDVKFSPAIGKYLAVGSHDNFVDIYHVENQKRIGICKGSSSYISHLDWDLEGKLIMINSGAKEMLFYEAPRGNRVNINSNEVFEIKWDTLSCVLGSNMEGIWPPCTDVTDVNSTHLAKNKKVLATGDDFGFVKLFDYPCPGKFAKFKRYVGHSAHVTRVRWTHDDSKLISIGGGDTATMIWENVSATPVEQPALFRSIQNTSGNSETLNKVHKRGESDDSETDSEDEGYDSDVRREQFVDYTKNIFVNPIKRVEPNVIKNLYEDAKTMDKNEASKPSRMTKTKTKRTKVNRFKGRKGEELDPWILLRFITNAATGGEVDISNATEVDRLHNAQLTGTESQEIVSKARTEINGLKLNHIHGYRGFDCRDNTFYVDDGNRIVYPAAGAGIVLEIKTGIQTFYLEHNDDIISLALNENPKFKNVVATGQIGVSPVIHVWNALTKETLSILSGLHKNGICSLNFSSSGKLLVSVGLDNCFTIGIWRWKEGVLAASHVGDISGNRIFKAAFRPDSDSVFVSVGFKHIRFWTFAGSELIHKKGVTRELKEKIRKLPTMLSIGFGQDEITYTGSNNGEIFIWKENSLINLIQNAHNGPIFSIYTTLTDGCLVTGAKERNIKEGCPIKVWDKDMKNFKKYTIESTDTIVIKSVSRVKNKILVGTKNNEIFEINEKTSTNKCLVSGHSNGAVWGLTTHRTKDIYATVSYDGYLKIWKVKNHVPLGKYNVGGPIRCVDMNKDGEYFALGLDDGEIIIIRALNNYTEFRQCDSKRQRNALIMDIKFSPNDKMIAVGSTDSSIDFFEFHQSDGKISRNGYCAQVPGSILQIDWSDDEKFIRTGTNEFKYVIFEAPSGNEIKDPSKIENVVWDQWSSPFGEEVVGIWPSDVKQDFINCVHLAPHAMVLATGDDNGAIKLYKFPCIDNKDSKYEQPYIGHSSNITNVKFIHDDSYLISTGGEDFCVFVWECV